MTENIRETAMRYIQDVVAGRKHHSEWTFDQVDVIRQYVADRFGGEDSIILHAFTSIESEFTRGYRCGVCGRTQAQNEAIGYDCAHEC